MSLAGQTYETLEIGAALGPIEHRVTAEMVRAYAEATGDAHPWHTGAGSPFGPPVAHPTLATIFSTRLVGRSGIERESGGIHVSHEYAFLAPVVVGRTVCTTGTVTGKYVKKGRRYIEFDAVSVDETGREVARCAVTLIVPE